MIYRGLAYRAHNPRWSWAPTSGEGAALHGGRFNPRGMPALYLSLDYQTAYREASQGFSAKPQPLTIVAYEVDFADLADLTTDDGCRTWDIRREDLACAWLLLESDGQSPPTWRLIERLVTAGRKGIVVRSFAPGSSESDLNLVLWSWGNDLPHRVKVIDAEARLPRDDRSWSSAGQPS